MAVVVAARWIFYPLWFKRSHIVFKVLLCRWTFAFKHLYSVVFSLLLTFIFEYLFFWRFVASYVGIRECIFKNWDAYFLEFFEIAHCRRFYFVIISALFFRIFNWRIIRPFIILTLMTFMLKILKSNFWSLLIFINWIKLIFLHRLTFSFFVIWSLNYCFEFIFIYWFLWIPTILLIWW